MQKKISSFIFLILQSLLYVILFSVSMTRTHLMILILITTPALRSVSTNSRFLYKFLQCELPSDIPRNRTHLLHEITHDCSAALISVSMPGTHLNL